ncbi:MAG: threonine/serine exporter family protein, partial [Lachnospiraceae bacterium]
ICDLIYLIVVGKTGSVAIASFFAALTIAFASHIFARFFKAPVTVIFIPGMLPLVPGGQIYSAVYALLNHDKAGAYEYLMLTLQIAGVIALAIFIMDTIFQMTAGQRFGKIREGHILSRKKTD